jgi:hypothetical protein
MNDVRNEELVRLSFRRELTPEEESRLEGYFAANPRARAQWEEERVLSRAVQSLPDVPVSSNFTARVLQGLDLEEAREERREAKPWLRILWPRFGLGVVAALLGYLAYQHGHRADQRDRVVRALSELSKLSGERMPQPDELQDFKAINWLRGTPAPSDDELLIALQ